MLAKSGQKTALAGDWPKAIASQGWLIEGRRRGDIASASPAPMTDIANILRRNGQFSSGTSLHSVKQAPACWGLRPQSPKREASADKATAAPHVAAALCQAQGWLPRISPILNVPSPADWRNLDATAVLIARPSPKLPRGPETLEKSASTREHALSGWQNPPAHCQNGCCVQGTAGNVCLCSLLVLLQHTPAVQHERKSKPVHPDGQDGALAKGAAVVPEAGRRGGTPVFTPNMDNQRPQDGGKHS